MCACVCDFYDFFTQSSLNLNAASHQSLSKTAEHKILRLVFLRKASLTLMPNVTCHCSIILLDDLCEF